MEPSTTPTGELLARLDTLHARLAGLGSAIVAFSGGVDSAFLLAVAHRALGDRCVALTALSPSLAPREREAAEAFARRLGARHILRETAELHDPRYASNPANRCYFCKSALFDVAAELQRELAVPHVLLGTNLDDLHDHRPGLQAARERGALSPLADAGLRKQDVRDLALHLCLEVWDKPAAACLASRFPYGVAISHERLERIARCEELLYDLGFRGARARFHGDVLRLELRPDDLARALEQDRREALIRGCKAQGFLYVTVDLEGYRQGALNEALPPTMRHVHGGNGSAP